MNVVADIDLETLYGAHGEEVIKDVSVVGEYVRETFRFPPPYTMEPHGSTSSGFNCYGFIPYSTIIQTLSEATANFTNLYSKGPAKCRLITVYLDRPITNLDDFGCPSRESFVPGAGCSLPCHKFPDKSCAVRNARSLSGG